MTQELPEPVRITCRPWRRQRAWSGFSRSIAALTAFAFLLSQLAMTAVAEEQHPLPSWLRQEEGGWVSPEQAGRMQRADQDLLAHLSALQEAQNRFVITDPSGHQTLFVRPEPVEGRPAEPVVSRDTAGNLLWSPTLDDYQKLRSGTLLLADGTLQVVRDGRLNRQVDVLGNESFFRPDGRVDHEIAADGTRTDTTYADFPTGAMLGFTRTTHTPTGDLRQDYDGESHLTALRFTETHGAARLYAPDGNLQTLLDPDGTRWTVDSNGWITRSVTPGGVNTTYSRTNSPLGQQVQRTTGDFSEWFSFDPGGTLYAAGTSRFSSLNPLAALSQTILPPSLSPSSVVASDGTYLYVKTAGGTNSVFQKIGTGMNGTVAGKKYGSLTGAVKGGLSATGTSDGMLYQPDPTNLNRVERIHPATGQKAFVSLATPFLPSQSSPAGNWSVLITSDGRYVYNLSSHQNRSSTAYNGWTIRVYDPKNNWAMVRELRVGTTSYAPAGFFSDGTFLYLLENKTSGNARVSMLRIADSSSMRTWNVPASQRFRSGQYDWRNQRIWVGTASGSRIYAFNEPNDLPLSSWADREGLRTPVTQNRFDVGSLPDRSGDHSIQVQFQDAAGNWSAAITRAITLAAAPPVLTLASPERTAAAQSEVHVLSDGKTLWKENWALGRGINQIPAETTDLAGNKVWRQFAVTREGALPNPTDPTADGSTAGKQWITQTLADGSVAAYADGQLVLVTTSDGTRLIQPTRAADGKVTGGWLVTAEGTTTYLENSAAVWSKDALGGITWYFPDGKVEAEGTVSEQGPPAVTAVYAYQMNSAGTVLSTLVTTGDISTRFDAEGRRLQQIRGSDNRQLIFSAGRLSEIQWPDAVPGRYHLVRYSRTMTGGGMRLSRAADPLLSDLPVSLRYVGDDLQEITQSDGTVIRFENGIPSQIISPDGTASSLSVQQSSQLLSGLTVTRAGITRTYNAQGRLASLRLADGSNLVLDNDQLKSITLPDLPADGSAQVTNGAYDADNHLTSGTVTLPDGRNITYAGGQPTEARLPDGTKIIYTDGKPNRMILSDGLEYSLIFRQAQDERAAEWIATLNPDVIPVQTGIDPRFREDDTLTQLVYTEDWILQETTRSDGARLIYRDGRLNTLTQADGTVISYAYDNASRLTSTVAASPDPAEAPIRSEYAYDKIRKVYKGSTLIYNYSYEFETDGTEITVVHEPTAQLTKRYRGNLLISQTDPDGAVTTYEYSSNSTGYTDPLATAVGMIQMLPGGVRAHYDRTTDPAQSWKLTQFTRPDGTAINSTGKTNDSLTDVNGLPSTEGKIGRAARFSPDSSRYLTAPDSEDLSMGDIGFTLAAWVYIDSKNGSPDMDILGKGIQSVGSPNIVEYQLRWGGPYDRFEFLVSDGSSGDLLAATSYGSPPTGQWIFVAAWHDTENNTLNLQVNNGPINSVGYAVGSHDSISPLTIGRSPGLDRNYWWNGKIDEVGIWKKALTTQERADLYNTGAGNTYQSSQHAFQVDSTRSLANGLVAYYGMEEPFGTRADSAHDSALEDLLTQATLPSDPTALRRMVETGTLQLLQPAVSNSLSSALSPLPPVLSRATVTYQGKERDNFTYHYTVPGTDSGSSQVPGTVLTRVTDSAGVTRAYDGTHQLVSIEQPDGTRYDVSRARDLSAQQTEALQAGRKRTLTYTDLDGHPKTLELPDPDLAPFEERAGEEITIQHLSRRLLKDGTELLYQFGRLHKILLPDRRILTDFTVDRNGIPLRATLTLPDGSTRAVQNGALLEVTRPEDGVKLRYRNNAIAEIHVPVNPFNDVTVSSIGLDPQGRLQSGEVLVPRPDGSGSDRLTLSGSRFTAATLADGTQVQSVSVTSDSVTGATLAVSGSNATLNNTRDVGVTLPSGQEYRYRYQLDSAGNPTDALETMTFRDDFEDGNSLGWRTTGNWSITGGDLHGSEMVLNDNHPSIYAQTGLNWADYTVTTHYSYEQLTGKASEARLLFRYQDDNNYYVAQTIRRTSGDHAGWHLLLGGRVGGQSFVDQWIPLSGFSESGSHTLSVEVRGSAFRVYLDGIYQGSFNDGRMSQGSVGYSVATAVVRFHDIEVTFPGEDLRDPATRDVDAKLRGLRATVAQAAGSIAQISVVPAEFNSSAVNAANVRILETSADPDVQAAVTAVVQASADPNLAVVTEIDAAGRPLSTTKVDGSVTTYDESGRPIAQYDQEGRRQVRYAYDANGRLIKTTLEAARADLNERFSLLAQEITRRQADADRALAEKVGVVNQELEIQVQVAREQLANQGASMQSQLQFMENTAAKGKAGKTQKAQILDQIRGGAEQIRQAQDQLEHQYIEALGKIRGEIASANQQIQEQTASSFAQLQVQKETFLKGILRQEILPVLGEVYRLTIGRDPNSETEVNQLVDEIYAQFGGNPSAAVNRDLLKQRIRSLPEYQERVDQVAAIKQRVTDWLTSYVQSSDHAESIEALGLAPTEVVSLTPSDADRILAWLNSSSLHFGHSAFLALQEYLSAQGIQADAVSLAVETIQIDILVGVINPKTTGDLELSLFALQRTARLHGGSATPVKVSFDDLRSLVIPAEAGISSSPVIAHVNGNHYILVTGIADDGTVTYREPNQGPTGQTLTMSRAEFERVWQGVILSPRAPPHAWQILTDHEAQTIRGSFVILIAFILFVISTGLQFVQNETVQLIGRILGYIAMAMSVFSLAFQAINTVTLAGIKTAFSGFGQGLISGLQTLGHSVWQGLIQVAHTLFNPSQLRAAFQAVAPAIGETAKATLPQLISTTVFTTGVNYGVARGFEALGVDPAIASMAGSLASGGIAGSLGHGSTQTFWGGALSGSLTNAAIAGTQIGLAKAGVDANLASLGGIGVGSITSSLISGVNIVNPATGQVTQHLTGLSAVGYTLSTSLAPTLAGELAFYGIQRLGESIGLDPRISQIAGMPIRSAITVGTTPGATARNITDAIGRGLLEGATSVGLQKAAQSLDLDPLTGAVVTRALSGAVSGAISSGDVFKGAYDAFRHSAGNFSTIPPPPDPEDSRFITTLQNGSRVWNRTAYDQAVVQYEAGRPVWMAQAMAKTNNFSDEIRQYGLGQAVENYATSIFHRDSVESLVQSFGTIKDAITQRMQQNKIQNVTLDDGTQAKKLSLVDGQNLSLLYKENPFGDVSLLGVTEDDLEYLYQEIRADRQTHETGMRNGTTTRTLSDGSKLTLEVRDGQVAKAHLTKGDQSWLFTGNEVGDLQISPDGRVFTGQLIDETTGISLVFQNGMLKSPNELSTVTLISMPGLRAMNAADSAMAQIEAKAWGLYSPDPAQPINVTAQQTSTAWEHFIDGNLREATVAILGKDAAEPLLTELKTLGKQTIDNSTTSGSTPSEEFQQGLSATENQVDKLLDAIQHKLESSSSPTIRSLGGLTVGLFQGFGEGISDLGELATDPIGTLVTFGKTVATVATHPRETASAIKKSFQEVLAQSEYQQGRTIGRIGGSIIFSAVLGNAVGRLSAGTKFLEGATYTAEDLANIQRSRVLAGVAESRAARTASKFEVLLAKEAQLSHGYNPDNFSMLFLKKGDLVYGGLPGQGAFYTNAAALETSGLDRVKFFQSVQVLPSPTDWYRPQVGVYKLTEDVWVPGGIALANSQAGLGGEAQYFVREFKTKLELVDTIDLK